MVGKRVQFDTDTREAVEAVMDNTGNTSQRQIDLGSPDQVLDDAPALFPEGRHLVWNKFGVALQPSVVEAAQRTVQNWELVGKSREALRIDLDPSRHLAASFRTSNP